MDTAPCGHARLCTTSSIAASTEALAAKSSAKRTLMDAPSAYSAEARERTSRASECGRLKPTTTTCSGQDPCGAASICLLVTRIKMQDRHARVDRQD